MLNNRLLNERYLIKEMIGGGGMANVYLGKDTILERDVAIKVLRLEYGNDEEFIARFHREAQSATSLSHPNIVNIYDVGEEDDIYYMVMEHIDGMTLKKYIQLYSPVDVTVAIDIMQQVTSAIAQAHDNGIVHRDIKPDNILIDHYGQVKVTDFGIAMALSATALTQTNSILGSVHYLSPEQARGGVATKKSDIYSMGIVMFELLTGRLPFSGESAVSVALKHLQNDTPSLKRWNPDLPQSVENVVLKATAKDPLQRYANVHEMEHDMETSLDPERMDEAPFVVEDDLDEKTKAIPVITKEAFENNHTDETIVHTNGKSYATKPVEVIADKKQSQPEKKKEKKKKKVWPWLLTIFLVLLAAGAAALFLVPGLLEPKDVEMIDVKGMEYEEAYSELRNLNLQVERETEFSDKVEEGNVIRTDPEAGETIKEGATVTVYSSDGKETTTFGDYVGDDYEQTKTELEAKGFSIIESYEKKSTDYEEGIIMDQFPKAGEEVVPEDTQIMFRVSAGPPPVELESLIGYSQSDAESYLKENNLKVEVQQSYSDDTGKGKVMSQKPSPGIIEQGSTVKIEVSMGPEAKPRTHTETVMVKYEPPEDDTQNQDNPEQGDDNSDGENQDGGDPDGQNQDGKNKDNTPEEEPPGQKVIIYVKDNDSNGEEEVYEEATITEDTEFKIEMSIAPGSQASYRVLRDDEIYEEQTIEY